VDHLKGLGCELSQGHGRSLGGARCNGGVWSGRFSRSHLIAVAGLDNNHRSYGQTGVSCIGGLFSRVFVIDRILSGALGSSDLFYVGWFHCIVYDGILEVN
jgi:hypothetical protein